jgi:ABC-type sugar transport system ATPase subunit
MIELDNLSVAVGDFRLDGVSFAVPTGEYAVLMGPTGCGKTTLLETIAGLREATAGAIRLDEREVTKLRPGERGIGYVPQDAALFSTMTVREHLAFAPRLRGWTSDRIEGRVHEIANLLAIEPLLDRYPQGLSGGETRRVALGRALAAEPAVLLLDEPLTGLDETTCERMYAVLKDAQRATGVTLLHVTHSRDDARMLADRCFRMEDGSVVSATINGRAV